MTREFALDLGRQAIWTALLVGGPLLGLSLLAGLVISVFQAATQIQEQSLSFLPKAILAVVALVVFGPWMLATLTDYTGSLFRMLPTLVQ